MAGNLTQISGSAHTRNCTYDALDRPRPLKEGGAGTITHAYDNGGKLQSMDYLNRVVHTYGYDNQNQVTSGTVAGDLDSMNGNVAYTYDANGNTQSWNRYAYVLNSPLSYIDPSGFGPCPPQYASACNMGNHSYGVSYQWNGWDMAWDEFDLLGMILGPGQTTDVTTSINGVAANETITYYPRDLSLLDLTGGNSSGSTTWLQTKVFFQALGRNFIDEFKPGGCVNAFGKATVNALNPFSPSLSSAGEGTAAVLAASKYNAAVQYAASATNYLGGTGLIYPMKSSVVRSMLADANATAASGGLITLDLALAQGFGTEMYDMATGACH